MATMLTFYGGVGEIGGNLISLRLEEERIHVLFDAGLSFSAYRRFFDFPFRIPQESVELELVETEILPKIDSLSGKPMRYYADLVSDRSGYHIIEPPTNEIDIEDVFISHMHSDHSKLCTLLGSSCKIHMGDLACGLFLKNALLSSRSDLFSKLFFSDAKSVKARHSYRTFASEKAIKIGGLEILPIAVDHSTPSSFGFIVTCQKGTIAYTGDIRFHGMAAKLSREFVREARRMDVDLLITEGTNIGEARPQGEADISKFTSNLIERSNRSGSYLTLVKASPSDIDRISTIVSIARDLGNKIVLTKGVASTIYVASSFRDRLRFIKLPDLKDCRILITRDDSASPADRYARFLKQKGLSELFLNLSEYRSEYSRIPHVIISRGDLNLFKLKPPPRSLYIFSTSEPATEEEFNLERELNTAQLLGLLFYHVHASGHASPLDLEEMVRQIGPKKLIPIHTEHPNIFGKIFSKYTDVVLPQKGKPITI
ncbi:MAG: MBL fold metallo-hydrolase [Thermoproteota archaeon]